MATLSKHKSSFNTRSHLRAGASTKPHPRLPKRDEKYVNGSPESYKVLKLPLTKEQHNNKSIESLLSQFNENFDADDIYLSQNGSGYEIRLNS